MSLNLTLSHSDHETHSHQDDRVHENEDHGHEHEEHSHESHAEDHGDVSNLVESGHGGHSHDFPDGASIWDEYIFLMGDAAHVMVELTFVLLHILAFEIIRRSFKRWTNRRFAEEHARLDAEHGVEHAEEGK